MTETPTLLQDKVVVLSGVGPGLGRTLAVRCAESGAAVVLAARTKERLDEVVAEITASGGRAVAVPTDITDRSSAENLVREAIDAFGRVDVLVNNAFSVPSMKPLADTDFDRIRASFELTVLGALRLTQLFTPALAESRGAVVDISSMVIRHSQQRYGSYKIAKSALLAQSQSLASELGGHGIRVNSVAPGYIWGETLKGYFAHQAGKYGTTVEQIYEATAANTDLGRLPTTEEVADAVLFLASPLASGITGQCLDVNCGEFHH
ncbi:SDR family oxidoreductase [Rhodococcus triatomae]|uniref:NAD(P)-dependent dehydrogenase, short-chain alcohol dehydrogenase family n=1 Tax=Rhodococcus triatomae TaxID=300028 RepID=A0A1G8LXK2_9NOCA|nr:SDR family oxidoreductase [Rhodococcus triatomae]QNG18250.1 SDR family oxidoreductase [Rhodococcus triatomae]QNG22079.1 SDR family oxidoreductase [Rhodococcus triatomae]SDI60217.1 NAD(P)-dependent dehydrogenase, short-chain alcohol dehydrogenase family [Rhodococcus triatomae]